MLDIWFTKFLLPAPFLRCRRDTALPLQAAFIPNGRQQRNQPTHVVRGVFALSGGGSSSSDDSTADNSKMSPAEAGVGEGASGASAPLMSSPSLSGDVGGDEGNGGGSEKGGPAVVNVAKVEASSPPKATSTLWNVPNMLTMARVVAIPVRFGRSYIVQE